jgi:hypothetical protein
MNPLSTFETFLQANERGRQARARVRVLLGLRAQQEEELRRQRMGGDTMSTETAAIKMQAAARGFLAKRRAKRMVEEELVFVGERSFDNDGSNASANLRS